ncbi:MAG: hypothetical protein KBT29_12230 [Prevotellaceae bacterium]|nr:hypothetical protein [Candidatus Minthosoma caballi]
MNQQLLNDISKYVEQHIEEFHTARIAKLKNMNLKEILKRKNPYIIKAMCTMTVSEFAEFLVDDALYKINNDLFNDWIKDITLFVSQTIDNNHCEDPQGTTLREFCLPEYWAKKVGYGNFFTEAIEPAIESCFKEDNECYIQKVRHLNRFTKEILDEFCDSECAFDWDKLKKSMIWE